MKCNCRYNGRNHQCEGLSNNAVRSGTEEEPLSGGKTDVGAPRFTADIHRGPSVLTAFTLHLSSAVQVYIIPFLVCHSRNFS